MNDNNQLKTCPFCGGKVSIESYTVDEPFTSADFGFKICCPKCGIGFKKSRNRMTGFDLEADEKAKQYLIGIWNTRY